MPEPWTHHQEVVDGIRLHWVEAGAGPLVLLLHGFPEFWYSWRHQLPALAAAGLRAVAPDLRGYARSEKPPGVVSYRIEALIGDAAALIHALGEDRARVVGHDWGGIIAWQLAIRRPETVERLAILNAPHPAALARELRTLDQLRRSWYAFFFQLPWLPEAALRARDFAAVRGALRHDPALPAFDDEDIARYRDALAQPGALTSAIHYYRAAFRRPLRLLRPGAQRIEAPTLLIWGERDRHLRNRLTEGLEAWVPDLRVERLSDVGHWVQNEAPDRVNRLLVEFLAP